MKLQAAVLVEDQDLEIQVYLQHQYGFKTVVPEAEEITNKIQVLNQTHQHLIGEWEIFHLYLLLKEITELHQEILHHREETMKDLAEAELEETEVDHLTQDPEEVEVQEQQIQLQTHQSLEAEAAEAEFILQGDLAEVADLAEVELEPQEAEMAAMAALTKAEAAEAVLLQEQLEELAEQELYI